MRSFKYMQTVFPKRDAKVLLLFSSANRRGDTSPQIQVINPNRGRFVLLSKIQDLRFLVKQNVLTYKNGRKNKQTKKHEL